MEITKNEIIEALREDVIDRMCEHFYEWVFEEESDIQEIFTQKLVKGILDRLGQDVGSGLLNKLNECTLDTFIENNEYEIKSNVIDKCCQKLLKDIKLKVDICKK